MRDACRIRITKEMAQALQSLFSLTYNAPIVAENPPLREFLDDVVERVLQARQPDDLIEEAVQTYALTVGDNNFEVDDDAPLSEADDGIWVGSWVWLYKGEVDSGEEDKSPAENQAGG